jgi:hypothetical protein
MRLFYSLNGFKISKRAKNNYLLFLVYFRYFSEFIFKQIRVFSLGFLNQTKLNQNKRLADSLGSLVSHPEWA